MKKYHIVFSNSEEDQRLLKSSVAALSSNALSRRYGHTVVYDDATEKFTLRWWRIPEGGWNEKQG